MTAKAPYGGEDTELAPSSITGRPTEPAPEPTAPGEVIIRSSSPGSSVSGSTQVMGPGRQSFDSFDEIAAPIADPLIGVVVAERYRILELLGRGGMGIVYRVEHTRIGKLLAMKLLTGELSRNAEVVRRFKTEALTVSKLSSANTVQVFDFGVSDGLTYLVMELVTGEDLGRVLRTGGPLPASRLARIMIQVCSSLAEAHQKGIVHRDMKPENIMLMRGRDGTDIAKVLDFGLAKIREGTDLNDVTSQGAIVGTPYFMSPEQIRGDQVDNRSDVYSMGAVMYRALTGHYPFNGPTPMAVFTRHLTETPPPPIDRAPEIAISQNMSDIIVRALEKDPARRWQRVEDLQSALVDESRGMSTSSVEALLDSKKLRDLTRAPGDSGRDAVAGVSAPAVIATRDEVERYERKLRRKRWGLFAFALLVPATTAGAGVHYYLERPVEFGGVELEPNDEAQQATVVPLGRKVAGYLGKRIDATTGDRDFYSFVVPNAADASSPSLVSLEVTALPNFPVCTFLYKQGQASTLAQYCVGRPGRNLEIPQLALPPGEYLAAIMQDLDPYGDPRPPFVYENVSDAYELVTRVVPPDPDFEVEPNDNRANATSMALGVWRKGRLGWSGDEDVYCGAKGDGPAQWRVEDSARDPGTVLLVTRFVDGREGAPVRVYSSAPSKPSELNATSPWTSEPVSPDEVPCVKVELVSDPLVSDVELVPRGSLVEYRLRLESP